MKLVQRIALAGIAAWVAAACAARPHDPDHSTDNMWVGEKMSDEAAERAVVAQSTLFPHHFLTGSARLTPLGERDLSILADALIERPGSIAVRRGGVDEVLFAERIASVRQGLLDRGLDPEGFELTDGLSGGSGISSEDMRQSLKASSSLGSGTSNQTSAQSSSSGVMNR
jgi:hypothetical protein